MYDYTTVEPKDSTGQKAIVYLHNDHIGQVQFAFDSDGQMIYERIQTPFGETMGEMAVYNVQVPVRFPGQYADAETGYSDNWNRTYDPVIGRYVQSDPIGLRGGINTYGYVGQNPMSFIDKKGLREEYTKSKDRSGPRIPNDERNNKKFPDDAGKCWRTNISKGQKDKDKMNEDSECDCKTKKFVNEAPPQDNHGRQQTGTSDPNAATDGDGASGNAGGTNGDPFGTSAKEPALRNP